MNDAAKDAPGRARLTYSLADLTVDVGTAQVHRNGEAIPLPRLSFDLLVALIESAPNLVTVDELMDRVWPGIVVNSETVSQRVKLLRLALEDDPRNPRYIAVSRGRGYRIIAPVTRLDLAGAASMRTESAQAAVPETKRAGRSRWTWGALAACALVGLVLLLVVRRVPSSATPATASLPDRSVEVLPFDNVGQSPQDAALAFGVAETLLHRLSASKELTVIARQSSFSFAPRGADVRDIGRRLNARYLIEGSLQSTPTRLRITAQLIDAATGGHVWSLQFDRKPEDIFTIQDEIAAKVTEALRISVAAAQPFGTSGTQDFDAYLAHAQGRARLAVYRVADAKLAVADFERAIQIDPRFTRAYAGLAEARGQVADGEMSRERRSNIQKVAAANRELLNRAVEINDQDSDVHLQLAWLLWEGEEAEKELTRALELNPNSAAGYHSLALMRLFRDRRPDEAIAAIDKARLLSPLEVRYDNEKAMMMLYGKSDAATAEHLLLAVLERDPSSTEALWRLGELYWCCRAEHARGVKFLEQALQRDPDQEFGRRILMRAYLDLNDPEEAKAIAAMAPHPVDVRLVPVMVYNHEWQAAAERTYYENSLGTSQAIDTSLRVLAVRKQARITGNYEPALQYLAEEASVRWDEKGNPSLDGSWVPDYIVGLADILMQMGERDRGERLLDAVLKSIDDEAHHRNRGERWYLQSLSVAYVLLGRDEEALTALEKCVAQAQNTNLAIFLESEPAYERLRSQPRFEAVVEQMRRMARTQRDQLDRMRAKGLVPHRSGG